MGETTPDTTGTTGTTDEAAGERATASSGYTTESPRVSRRRAMTGTIIVAASAAVLALELGPRVYDTLRLRQLDGRRVYDEDADCGALFADAKRRAAAEGKPILVVLGGNWCRWCLSLDDLMTSDPQIASLVAARFVLLKLDGDRARDLDEAWGSPTKQGVPVLVFLDPGGRVLHVQPSGPLEAFGGRVLAHDRDKVLAVLKRFS